LIAILDKDREELAMIEDPESLDPDSRRVLSEELALRYFTARVISIPGVKSRHGLATWELTTDRGRRTAYIKDRGDLRWLPGGHVILTDVGGVRYDVPDISLLDERSRALLEEQL
jgi:hypothetical protein